MVCIYCSGKTGVINSRPKARINQIWRRRQCLECGAVFTTREIADYSLGWTVDGGTAPHEPFSRDRLLISLHKSLAHRPYAIDDANNLVDTLIMRLNKQQRSGYVDRNTIILMAHVVLSRFDKQAAMHYRAFHNTH